MRYLIVSARFSPFIGGVETFTWNLASTLVSEGDTVCVLTSQMDASPERETTSAGFEVVRLPSHAYLDGRLPWPQHDDAYRSMLDSFGMGDIDRVLVNTRFYPICVEGLDLASERGVPALVLDHGSAHLTLGNRALDVGVKGFEHHMTDRVKRYDPIFCGISKASARWLEHFGIEGAGVIPNAIDADAFRAQTSGRDFRRELAISAGRPLAIFAGRLEPEKGILQLVDAARILEDENITFAFAGDGSLTSQISSHRPENVNLLGPLSRPDMSALFQQSDILCLPSRSEGFSTALLEAAACGVVPVMTHVGGTDELIEDGRSGILLASDAPDAIVTALRHLLESPEDLIAMRRAIRENVERRCTWNHTTDALREAFS